MRKNKVRDKKPSEVIPATTVTITREAAEKIKDALERHSASGVRIGATINERGGISFTLDTEDKAGSDDLVLEDNGVKFFVDPSSGLHIQGIEIRYVKAEKGAGFSVAAPGG